MNINFNTSEMQREDMTALIALLHSLGGRLPDHMHTLTVDAEGSIAKIEREPLPVFRKGQPDEESDPLPSPSERLIAQAASAANPGELDKDGIPWDARIHASSKAKNADGTWRKMRGVNEITYGEVFAELQERYAGKAIGTNGSGTAPLAGHSASEPDAPPPPMADDEGNDAPPPPPEDENANTADVSAPVADAPKFAGFPDFVAAVNKLKVPQIPYVELNNYAAMLGVAGGFKDMKDAPHLWDDFVELASPSKPE